MTKVQDLISDALCSLGVIDPTESLDPGMANRALRRLNAMMSSWSTQGLMVFTSTRKIFPLTIGQDSYTLGVGGNLNTERPVWFNQAGIIPVASSPTLEIPIGIMDDVHWQEVAIKSLVSNFPLYIHPRGDYPLNTIDVWPVPTVACSLVLYVPEQLQSFATVQDDISLPPGYETAIVPNLTVMLAPMFSVPTPPEIARMATTTKDTLKAQNLVVVELKCDSSYCGTSIGPSENAIRSKGWVVD